MLIAGSVRRIEVAGRGMALYSAGSIGPAVVLISGGGMPAAFAAPLQERIATFSRVVSYDRAGLGDSEPASQSLSFDAHAQHLHELLAAQESGPHILVAESVGGLVARSFCRQFPQAVAGLVLVDAAEEEHVFRNLDCLLRSGRQQMVSIRVLRSLGLLGPLMSRALPPSFTTEQRRRVSRIVGSASHWDAALREPDAYSAVLPEQRLAGGFGSHRRLPLTVIAHGKPFRGPLAPLERGWREGQHRLAGLSERSRFIVAERCGHGIAQEDPDLVAGEVRLMRDQLGLG